MNKTGITFLALGFAFFAIGLSVNRTFVFAAIAFIALAFVLGARRR
jgi:hypothetical protein